MLYRNGPESRWMLLFEIRFFIVLPLSITAYGLSHTKYNEKYGRHLICGTAARSQPAICGPMPDKMSYVICLIDIDHFKQINDTYGHEYGDSVLKEMCARIKKTVRKQDICIRWGGEEFLIILRNINALSIREATQRIQTAVSSTSFSIGNHDLRVTISGGIYPILPCSVANFTEVDTLINIADKALYYAKTNGRDQFIMAECADDLPCTKVERFLSI